MTEDENPPTEEPIAERKPLGWVFWVFLVVFIFMGPVTVLGSYFVLAQSAPAHVIFLAFPIGFLVAAILHVNNMRDLEGDKEKGKRTLANLLGRRASRIEYQILVWGSYAVLAVLVVLGYAPWFALLALFTLPSALKLVRQANSSDAPPVLNKVLRGTAKLHERFGWLMIAGIVVGIVARLG